MKIAALQMVSTPDVGRNLDAAGGLIERAAGAGAQLVALPEYFCLMGRRDDDKLAIAEAPGDGPIQRFLAAQARRHGLRRADARCRRRPRTRRCLRSTAVLCRRSPAHSTDAGAG